MGALAIPIAMAGVGAAGSAIASSNRNGQLQDNANQAARATAAEDKMRDLSAIDQTSKLARAVARFVSGARVSAAERNIGSGGSAAAIEREILLSGSEDAANIQTNKNNQAQQGAYALQSHVNQLQSQVTSPLMQGIQGGLAGLQTGLSLQNSISNLGNAQQIRDTVYDRSYEPYGPPSNYRGK